MPPASVLLNRSVDVSFDEDDDDESAAAIKAMAMGGTGTNKPSFIPALYEATVATLGSMKPDAVFLQPPEITTLRLRGSKSRRGSLFLTSLVACADKTLLVLYGGRYFGPGSSRCGCYLVYDAAAAHAAARLSTVLPPPIEVDCRIDGVGSGAVVLRRHLGPASSPYLLAELAAMPDRKSPEPDALLFLWRSDEQEQPTPQWARKEVHLPREVCCAPDKDRHMFFSDTSFAGPGGCLCWVDLLQGIVVCTNPLGPGPGDPELRFIPLPDGCPTVSVTDFPYRPRAEENRSAACVAGGRIKLVAMVGELMPGCVADQYRLTTWTLSPDLSSWQQDGVFPLQDLWATDEYRKLNLLPPLQTPVCPVLSVHEDVVYAVLNDIVEHPVGQGVELEYKHQYVLGIDVRRNKIVSTSSGIIPPNSLVQMMPHLLSVDFSCASLHDDSATDHQHQTDVEASQVGGSGKRLKV